MPEPTLSSSSPLPPANPDTRFWDRLAQRYAASPIADPEGYERTLERVGALLTPDAEVLEVGCGTGTTALRLAPKVASYRATDLSEAMIAIAKAKLLETPVAGLCFEVETAECRPARPVTHDVVLAFNVLHLVPDLADTLRELRGRVRPGGLFIAKTALVAELPLWMRGGVRVARLFGKAPRNVRVFGEAALAEAIVEGGFTLEAVERHGVKGRDIRCFTVARRPE